MAGVRNIFACLVHEKQECVVDLVRNLNALDPDSLILLYNGSTSAELLDQGFPWERYGAVLHPAPHPARWGHLHPFALECMEWALENHPFDTLTIVDSDQLAMRPGYSQALATHLENVAGNPGILVNSASIQPLGTRVGPARFAHGEIELWRSFLRDFPQGESKWVHWSFWPSTIFLADAVRDLTRLCATNQKLRDVMAKSRIWASEEVILPTLISLLGYEVATSPFSYEYVQYRVPYTPQQVSTALDREDVFWMHPVPRSYEDPIRKTIRDRFHQYAPQVEAAAFAAPSPMPRLLLTLPILERMRPIEGWLDDSEADLLIAGLSHAVEAIPEAPGIVEIGSYCGKSTIVLASVLAALPARIGSQGAVKVSSIDPHNGVIGAADQKLTQAAPTLEKLRANLAKTGLTDFVDIIKKRSDEVEWSDPISFLFVDALHDFNNVSQDFYHFERFLVDGALIAFHDYADYYPGVKAFVDGLLSSGGYQKIHCTRSLMLVRKLERIAPETLAEQPVAQKTAEPRPWPRRAPALIVRPPLVSCLMPTADRHSFVGQAIEYFQRQDYEHRELIIIDDGVKAMSDMIPEDPRIRYVRLNRRHTIGAKHNIGCEMAHGEFIVHWDDDDWMADWRISYQIRSIEPQPVDTLSGLSRLLFWDPCAGGSWEYIYPPSERPWVAGGTFCYRRGFWEQHRFPEMNEGGDTVFVWGLRNARIQAIPNADFYVALVHANNTSRKRTETRGWHPVPLQRITALLGEDLSFYEAWSGSLSGAARLTGS